MENETVKNLQHAIRDSSTDIHELRDIWESRHLDLWQENTNLYTALTRRLKHRSQPFWVFEIASEGRVAPDCDRATFVTLSQMVALSLARTGATGHAQALLEELLATDPGAAGTLCLLGRLQKDLALTAKDESGRDAHLRAALSFYVRASDLTPDAHYPLINTATLTFLLGDERAAISIADKVVERGREMRQEDPDYWFHASLGEAELLRGNFDKARSHYDIAAEKIGHDYSSLQTMRRQVRQILSRKGIDTAFLNTSFPMPTVAVFSGHRIDAPGRDSPRFPEADEHAVTRAITETLATWRPLIAYASAAPGGDLIFCEAVLAAGDELRIVLPFDKETFRKYVVKDSDESWLRRFDRVMREATSVVIASQGEHDGGIQGSEIYRFVNQIVLGLALIESKFLDAPLRTMALWDGIDMSLVGGTSDCIALWKSAGIGLDATISPPGATISPAPALGTPAVPASVCGSQQTIKAILFADVVGYSKLGDCDLPDYFDRFLGEIARRIGKLGFAPLTSNSWGDAFYFVFESVREAGLFALEFRRASESMEWFPKSTGKPLRFRIALNAGPVFERIDPITGHLNFSGQHTNRAARIEPIVQEGQIYVSEYFAALAAAERVEDFSFDYVGYLPLPKKFDSSRVFILRET